MFLISPQCDIILFNVQFLNKKRLGGMEMSDDKNKENNQPEQESRRRFLKNSGLVAGGIVGGGLLGSFIDNPFSADDSTTDKKEKPKKAFTETRMFFTRHEDFAVLEAAVERIYPEDDHGPGAIGLGVPYFIDKQLAGPYGSNKFDYMVAPVQEVDVDSSYQTLMTRGDVFIEGVRKMNKKSMKDHDENFYDLEGETQDEILQAMEAGEIDLRGVKGTTFFRLLRQMTIEGAYADPLYGGNKDMAGWKMKEHPGIRPGYSDLIEEEEFQDVEQMSLRDYQS